MPVPHFLDYCCFISFEIRKFESSYYVLLFQNHFGYSESLAFPYELEDHFVNFCKKYRTAGIELDVLITLGSILTILKKINMGCLFRSSLISSKNVL